MVEIFDNIRSLYKFSEPCPELASYIDFFSESLDEETHRYSQEKPFTVKMFPSWTPTIWINMGAPYKLSLGDHLYPIAQDKSILVLRNGNVTRDNLPSDRIFTIKFFPGGLNAIFGISQSSFIDRVTNATEIIPQSFLENVKKQTTFENRIKLVQEFMLLKLKAQRKQDHYMNLVKDIIDMHDSTNIRYNTSEIAERLFTTSKTINRYFQRVIGVGPKRYFSILRARNALTSYISNKSAFEPDDHGYYDMSHFYKEAMQFTGQRMPALR